MIFKLFSNDFDTFNITLIIFFQIYLYEYNGGSNVPRVTHARVGLQPIYILA